MKAAKTLTTLLLMACFALVSCNGDRSGLTPEESKDCSNAYNDCTKNCMDEMNKRNKEINDCYKKCADDLRQALLECPCGEEGDQCREDAGKKYEECSANCDQMRSDAEQKTKDCNDNCKNEHEKCLDEAGKN